MHLVCLDELGGEIFERPASLVLIRSDSGELLAVAGEIYGQTLLGHCGEPNFSRLLTLLGLDRLQLQLPEVLQLQDDGLVPRLRRGDGLSSAGT